MLKITVQTSGLNVLRDLVLKHRRKLLESVGEKAFELARENFGDKSRGANGVDGPWKPIGSSAIRSRVQRMPEYSILKAQRKSVAREREAAMSQLKGEEKRTARANFKTAQGQLEAEYNKLYRKKSNGKIGVDTGATHASLLRGAEGSKFTIEGMAVEIATTVEHAGIFDANRDVMPEELPAEWVHPLEAELDKTLRTLAPNLI
jgi:hypothetical protein